MAKPILDQRHIEARLAWALRYQHWTVEDWSKVICLDESSIYLGKLAGGRYVLRGTSLRYHHDVLAPALKKHKKSVIIRSCFFSTCTTLGPLVYLTKGSFNSQTYCELLENTLILFSDVQNECLDIDLGEREYIFQQNKAPILKSCVTMEFMKSHHLRIMGWPANSPYLNLN